MAVLPSADELLGQLKSKITDIAGQSASSIRGYSETQLNFIAQKTLAIAELGKEGGLQTQADVDEATDGLKDMIRDFLAGLRDLVLSTIQQLWNSVVDILWKAIDKAVGAAIPIPLPRPGIPSSLNS